MMKNIVKLLLAIVLVITSGCTKSIDENDFIFRPTFLLTQESMNLRIKLQNQSKQELNDVIVKFYLVNLKSEEKILVKQYDDVDFKSTELKYYEFDITSIKYEYKIENEQILNDEYDIDFEIIV